MHERDRYVPPAVAITSVEIPFWQLVVLFIKAYFAWLVASAIIGAFALLMVLIFVLITGRAFDNLNQPAASRLSS